MTRSNHTLFYCMAAVCAMTLLAACTLGTVYSHYEHVPIYGWEKNDAIHFHVSPLQADGDYREEVGVRINGSYPFMKLTLIVDQTVFPSMTTYSDTLNCSLINEQGTAKGHGVSHYQYTFQLNTLKLLQGDSLHIRIRHDMKREILPGVADIGISLGRP